MHSRLLSALLVAATPTVALAAEGGGNPFAGKIFQAIAAAVVFLILFYLLKAKAWGPILQGLQDRERKIKADLENAEKAAKDANQTLAQYKQQLADAQREAQSIIEKSRGDAEKVATQLKNDAQTEITSMRKRAESDITAAKEQAISEIYAQVADLSTQIAGRIIRKEITPADQQQIVRESLSELTSQN